MLVTIPLEIFFKLYLARDFSHITTVQQKFSLGSFLAILVVMKSGVYKHS